MHTQKISPVLRYFLLDKVDGFKARISGIRYIVRNIVCFPSDYAGRRRLGCVTLDCLFGSAKPYKTSAPKSMHVTHILRARSPCPPNTVLALFDEYRPGCGSFLTSPSCGIMTLVEKRKEIGWS